MKIAWFCIPAHGHTNPTLGLVRYLTQAGHEVYYFSFKAFRQEIESAGAVFIDCDEYGLGTDDRTAADQAGKDLTLATELLVSATLALDDMATNWITANKPDVIVSDSMAYWGKLMAMKHGIPFISSTTTFAFNRHSAKYMRHGLRETMSMLLGMPKINAQLERLRQKGYPVKNVLDIIANEDETHTIVYTSRYFQPCEETFSDSYCFIGPSIRPITAPIAKKADRTVYISMGTINQNREFYRNCVSALADSGMQVIISMGENTDQFENLPSNIEVYPSVDQMAALTIADVFITHCGMNSASEGLYFRVPLVLFPQTSEQEAVARRVEELGAGVRLKSIAERDITSAVTKALSDPAYGEAAARVSDSFKACGGAGEAARFIERVAQGHGQTGEPHV